MFPDDSDFNIDYFSNYNHMDRIKLYYQLAEYFLLLEIAGIYLTDIKTENMMLAKNPKEKIERNGILAIDLDEVSIDNNL